MGFMMHVGAVSRRYRYCSLSLVVTDGHLDGMGTMLLAGVDATNWPDQDPRIGTPPLCLHESCEGD